MEKYTNIDEYIKNFPKETQEILQKIRKIITEQVPNFEETISYGIPTIKYKSKYVLYFAAFSKHVSVYPISGAMEEKYAEEIKKYRAGRGTLRFPLDKPIPYDFIKKIAKVRAKERISS